MSSFPRADELIEAYEDQVEALERLLHARHTLAADPQSRFHKLSPGAIQERLQLDREELDHWVVMMLVASFEATIRTDAKDRIQSRTRDNVRKPLRDLHDKYPDRVRLDDIRRIWEGHANVIASVKHNLSILLKHRHWLAHGRHWTNKRGEVPTPLEARADLDDYVQALQAKETDFPRG